MRPIPCTRHLYFCPPTLSAIVNCKENIYTFGFSKSANRSYKKTKSHIKLKMQLGLHQVSWHPSADSFLDLSFQNFPPLASSSLVGTDIQNK